MKFDVKQDLIDVTTMPRYTTVHKLTGKEIPLVFRGKYYCSDCTDEHDEYTFDKRFNSKNFQEKWAGGGIYKEFAPGLTHYFVDGIEIDKSEFESKWLLEKHHDTPTQ